MWYAMCLVLFLLCGSYSLMGLLNYSVRVRFVFRLSWLLVIEMMSALDVMLGTFMFSLFVSVMVVVTVREMSGMCMWLECLLSGSVFVLLVLGDMLWCVSFRYMGRL